MSFAQWSGIKPDLIVFGKALANGLPISVVGGSAKIMSGSEYFVSTTYAGDTLAMAAALKVLPIAKEALPQMWDLASQFQKDFNAINPDLIRLDGYPTRGVLWGADDMTKALFMQEMAKANVLFGSSWFWCEPHAYERDLVLGLAKIVISKIKSGEARLEGNLPKKPFAQKQRGS
jgi:acetylornithine/succinyldiaminopimelate/putrescine aminotransferase